MVTTKQLVKAFINSHHGRAVADQFEATFDGDVFEKQNTNALSYIEQAVRDVFNSNILNIEANDELEDYLVELKNYLQELADFEDDDDFIDPAGGSGLHSHI